MELDDMILKWSERFESTYTGEIELIDHIATGADNLKQPQSTYVVKNNIARIVAAALYFGYRMEGLNGPPKNR